MRVDLFNEPLQSLAREARPITQSAFFPLVKFAKQWGINIELRLYSSGKLREAQSILSFSQARILIYRRSTADGIVELTPEHEHLLKPRERFSVAHELGHCIAYRQFNALPVEGKPDTKEYRKQERCMNDFAMALLVPDWLRKFWLETVSAEEPVSPSSLTTWGVNHCAVSPEVVANALARSEPSVGFLKAAEAVRSNNGKRIFVVFHSSYGKELQLPNLHAFVDDETFVESIVGATGTRSIDGCFGCDSKYKTLKMSWQKARVSVERRRQEFRSALALSGTGYWLSFRLHRPKATSPAQGAQLKLFD